MGKPLLTDDIIARANRGEYDQLPNQESNRTETTVKSRRIENAKRGQFQSKLNRILFVVILLVILLIWAVFKW